jgi:hypothetical protein
MKANLKLKFILSAATGSMLLAASCDSGNLPNPYDVTIDSAVNAKMARRQVENATKNDSILNALAVARADSMLKAANKAAPPRKDTPVGSTTAKP